MENQPQDKQELEASCGFNVRDYSEMSKEQIVELYKELSDARPTYDQIKILAFQEKLPSMKVIFTKFKNMREFVDACSLE